MKKLINFRKNFHKAPKEIHHAFIGMGIVLAILIIGTVTATVIEPRSVLAIGFMISVLGFIALIGWMIELVEKNVIGFIDKKLTSGKAAE